MIPHPGDHEQADGNEHDATKPRDPAVLLRLRKITGQVQGVARMVEQDRYCLDVLQQVSAVQAALDAVGKRVTRNYLERCVTTAIQSGDPLIYDELLKVLYR